MSTIGLEMAQDLYSLVHGAPLPDPLMALRLEMACCQMARELGTIAPQFTFRLCSQLRPGHYRIDFQDTPVGQGEVLVDRMLVLGEEASLWKLDGIKAVHPFDNVPAVWVSNRQQAEQLGCRVFECTFGLVT